MISGTPPRTIPARKPALPMLMWTPRIIRTAFQISDNEQPADQAASCVFEADHDADDHAGRDPQNGQCGSCPSRYRAIINLSVVIETGLCLSGRTRRPARLEV